MRFNPRSSANDGYFALGNSNVGFTPTSSAVRDAIDAAAGGKRVDPKLIQLAGQNSNAIMGFVGVVSGIVACRIEFGTID